jgi:hypothetical protein
MRIAAQAQFLPLLSHLNGRVSGLIEECESEAIRYIPTCQIINAMFEYGNHILDL